MHRTKIKSLAVPTLIDDPQVGHCPGRTYDENVRLVRQTIHDIKIKTDPRTAAFHAVPRQRQGL